MMKQIAILFLLTLAIAAEGAQLTAEEKSTIIRLSANNIIDHGGIGEDDVSGPEKLLTSNGIWKPQDNPWFVTFDLISIYNVNIVQIRNKGDSIHDVTSFAIESSTDNDQWTTVEVITNVASGQSQPQNYEISGQGRYWKLTIKETTSEFQPWVKRFKFFGEKSSIMDTESTTSTPISITNPTMPAVCNQCANGKCIAPDVCQCNKGWGGTSCEQAICNQCAHGTCIAPEVFQCNKGWGGASCEQECDKGCDNCIHVDDMPVKCNKCYEGYTMDDQEQKCIANCANCTHGNCVTPGVCECNNGWEGSSCEQTRCPEGEDFFMLSPSSQCFKLFMDLKRTWYAAKDKCQVEGLVSAKPSDPGALQEYIVNKYDNYSWTKSKGKGQPKTWVSARGNGSNYLTWHHPDGGRINYTSPYFAGRGLPSHMQFYTSTCIYMVNTEKTMKTWPGKPYAWVDCNTPDGQYTVCETIRE